MFAVCVEKSSSNYGSQLIAHAKEGKERYLGLATMKFEKQLIHEESLQHDLKMTLIEQSIFDDMSAELTCSTDQQVYLLGWLRLDNKAELLADLALSSNEMYSDRELILKAYEKWGNALAQHLIGDFSLVLIDLRSNTAYLVRDHFGIRPLYYYQGNDCLFVTSSIAVIKAISGFVLTISEEFVVARCMSVSSDWVKTPYNEVKKLPPASIAEFTLNQIHSDPKVKKYYEFNKDSRLKLANEGEYIKRYQSVLIEAVKCRVGGIQGAVATESSGGIDSSTISALAAKYIKNHKEHLHAYGYVTCEQEEECINLLSQYVGIESTHLIKPNANDVDTIKHEVDRFVDYSGLLPTAYIATNHAPIYNRAKTLGAKVLLSGFGGDEFVTNYAATARVELLKSKQWSTWFNLFKGNFVIRRLRALKWLIRYLLTGNRFETATALSGIVDKILSLCVISQDKRDKFGIDEKMRKDALYDAGCESVNQFSLENRWSPDMTQRLEDCSLAAASHGIEYRWPLLDIRLVELFLSIPSEYKLRHGLPRYLHRKSIQGLVPEHIIWKDKDMGSALVTPNFETLKENDLFDSKDLDITQFPKEISDVLDEKRWQRMINKIKEVESKQVRFSEESQDAIMLLQPVIELAQWIKSN